MRKKAFTLVELLVVISVIALLLAILLPSLNKARELANRIVCGQHLKTLTQASNTYANTYDGFYVPLSFWAYGRTQNDAVHKERRYIWIYNRAYIKYIQKKELTGEENIAYSKDYALPREFLCPSDKITKDPTKATATVLTSYAYNGEDWGWGKIGDTTTKPRPYCGLRADKLKTPSEKMQFTDSIDWWCIWKCSDYRIGWDVLGQATLDQYMAVFNSSGGPVFYRHSEGANVGFYDGRVEWMKKTEIFVKKDYDSGDSPRWCGMWTSTGYTDSDK